MHSPTKSATNKRNHTLTTAPCAEILINFFLTFTVTLLLLLTLMSALKCSLKFKWLSIG